jgi:hypothetical protein
MRYRGVAIALAIAGCSDPQPIVVQQPAPKVEIPVQPAPPGQHTNHIGNPQAGSWGPDGQWRWKDPESKEATSTLNYLAAAGLGAAGGAALSYYFTKQHFEKQNPGGWSPQAQTITTATYTDKRGNPISEAEYRRRREQSERDRKRYIDQEKAKLRADRAKLEQERRQHEATRAPQASGAQQNVQPAPKPVAKPKPKRKLNINRWNRKKRR